MVLITEKPGRWLCSDTVIGVPRSLCLLSGTPWLSDTPPEIPFVVQPRRGRGRMFDDAMKKISKPISV